jgi:sulfonate transport system ATP-binding protein
MLEIRDVHKSFGDFAALGPLTLVVGGERVVTVIGPSGCGKSTLLRLVAGLEVASRGAIRLDGDVIAAPREDIGVAFQDPRLMPWLSVRRNVGLGLWDWPAQKRDAAIDAALAKVSLSDFADTPPKHLSGGMAQRVGLARALVSRPRLLLLDEPFGALDPLTRIRMQDYLLDIVGSEVPNVLLITHDIDEAIVLSDRIIVLEGPPARVRRDIRVDLARPRRRSSLEFQELKELLLTELFPDHIQSGSAAA